VSGFQIVSHTSTPGGPNPLHNWVKIGIIEYEVISSENRDLVEGVAIF
jgi:hypothetical protein